MWQKFLIALLLGLLGGSLGVAHFLTTKERGSVAFSSHKFGALSAEEINRRTLKAAASIMSAQRRN